jgi:hypothetical protein
MIGITLDNPWDYKKIFATLKTLKRKIHVRVVFDVDVDLKEYKIPIQEISKYAFIMGQVCDSFAIKDLSVDDYYNRCYQLYSLYDSYVTMWEIGNEVNGNWLGQDVVLKLEKAAKVFAPKQKVITLYADENKSYLSFIFNNKELLSKMQYILISEYPQDNSGFKVDLNELERTLKNHNLNTYWGYGECGTTRAKDKIKEFTHYYIDIQKENNKRANFIGGYFWWYQKDFVPNGPLLKNLQSL